MALDVSEHVVGGGQRNVCDDDSGGLSERDTLAAATSPQVSGKPSQFKGILHSYKGQSLQNSGYFFAPYVPITRTPTVFNPQDFEDEEPVILQFPQRYRSLDDPWDW